MEKYKINSLGKKIRRGYIIRDDNGEVIVFQFNPPEWLDTYKAVYNPVEAPGVSYPEINYIMQSFRTYPLTLEFDEKLKEFTNGSLYVEGMIDKIIDLTQPSPTMVLIRGGSKMFVEPPTCRFVFGDKVLKCKVAEVKVKRTYFDKNLNTTCATIDVELLEVV